MQYLVDLANMLKLHKMHNTGFEKKATKPVMVLTVSKNPSKHPLRKVFYQTTYPSWFLDMESSPVNS